jgi:hypothetical protein
VLGKIPDSFGCAAPRISSDLDEHRGRVIKPPEGFFVKGTEGPLEDGGLGRAPVSAPDLTFEVFAFDAPAWPDRQTGRRP